MPSSIAPQRITNYSTAESGGDNDSQSQRLYLHYISVTNDYAPFTASIHLSSGYLTWAHQYPTRHRNVEIIIMFGDVTLDIYCTSVRPGRGIPHMWLSLRFLLSFYLLKGFFSSFSLLLLRVKGRGCHTLLKPYETNCGLWIWAIQIKFDWLIDWCWLGYLLVLCCMCL